MQSAPEVKNNQTYLKEELTIILKMFLYDIDAFIEHISIGLFKP